MNNKEIVLKAMNELFHEKDSTAIERYWHESYQQHNPSMMPVVLYRSVGRGKRKSRANGVDPLDGDALFPAPRCTHFSTHSESSPFSSHLKDDSSLTSTLQTHPTNN